MREKMKRLPIAVTILIAIGVMLGFVLVLDGLGGVIGLIPGIDSVTPYMGQLLGEILVAAYGIGMLCLFGHIGILKNQGEGWLKSSYIAGFFIGYIVYDFIAQLYVQMMQTERNVQSAAVILIFTVTMLLVGFAEEVAFRGVILNLLLDRFPKTKGGILAAVIVNGVCFGALHIINLISGADLGSVLVQVITAGFMGAAFAALYVRTRNLWVCILSHALIDFASLFWGTLFQGDDLVSGINNISWLSLVAVPIFLVPVIIMLRKSKLEEAVRIANGEEIQPSEAEAKPVAIVSLIMGIISVVSSCYGYFMGLGVVGLLGALLSRRYKKEGNGLAKAALIVSAVGIAVNVIGIIFMIKVEIPMTSGLDMEQLMQQIKDLQNMQ